MPHPQFPNLTVLAHPLIQHKLAILRDKHTTTRDFKQLVNEIAMLMAYEVTKDLPLEPTEVDTPLEHTRGARVAGKKLALVPILRAGLGMVEGIAQLIPSARVGHIGIYREHDTLQPVDYYFKIPEGRDARDFFVLDPMLATGGSAGGARVPPAPARAPRPAAGGRPCGRAAAEPALRPRPRRPLRRHAGRRAAVPAAGPRAAVGNRAPDPRPPPRRRLGRGLRPRSHQHAARAHRARDRRALLSPGPRRPGQRQALAPGLHVRGLSLRRRPARELLRRPLLELDAAAAARRDAVAPGRPGGGRGRAEGRPQRRFTSRPPHGLASRRGRR